MLPDADAGSTMAITNDAPPDAIWPWLCQFGQEQGGGYRQCTASASGASPEAIHSDELAETLVGLDIHNADRVVLEWQNLEGDETVRSRLRLLENP